jgi:hypothetical protein
MSFRESVVRSCAPRSQLSNDEGTLKRGSRQERWAGLAEAVTTDNVPTTKSPHFSSLDIGL